MSKEIRRLVDYYIHKHGTRNPFIIASELGIIVQCGDLGSRSGCYMYLKKHRCIFLNQNLSNSEKQLVMAHELGHAIMHKKQNCYFIRNKTLLLNSKTEREANIFAAELLIDDKFMFEHKDYTLEQLTRLTGFDERLVELRLKNAEITLENKRQFPSEF